MSNKSGKYEENYQVLEKITESLNKDEIGIDDLIERTKDALSSARICMEILKKQKGEFKQLEADFSQLLQDSGQEEGQEQKDLRPGEDSPF